MGVMSEVVVVGWWGGERWDGGVVRGSERWCVPRSAIMVATLSKTGRDERCSMMTSPNFLIRVRRCPKVRSRRARAAAKSSSSSYLGWWFVVVRDG